MLDVQAIADVITSDFALPVIVSDILVRLDDPHANLATVQENVRQDIGLSSRLLAVANSPFYGFSGEIRSIKDAFIVLGTQQVKNIVLTTAVLARFSKDRQNGLDFHRLWQHSFGTAIAAGILAQAHHADPETAYIAGMLHDVGKMVLDNGCRNEYRAVCQYAGSHDCLLITAEQECLGLDHAYAGGWLLRHWHFPEDICRAVASHHEPDNRPDSLTDIVHIADILSRGLGIGFPGDAFIPLLSEQAMARMHLDMTALKRMLPRIDEEAQRVIRRV